MRRLALLTAGAAIVATATVSPANASTAACPYPPNNPNLSINLEHTSVRAGQLMSIGGYLTRNGCGLSAANVGLFYRTAPGRFFWRATSVTNNNGAYQFKIAPVAALDVQTIFSGDANAGRAVSAVRHIHVIPL